MANSVFKLAVKVFTDSQVDFVVKLGSMVAYFCHHLSDLYVDFSDLYVDLSLIPSEEK